MQNKITLIDWQTSALVGKCITKDYLGKEVTMKTVFISKKSGRYVSDAYAKRYPSRVRSLKVKASNQFN